MFDKNKAIPLIAVGVSAAYVAGVHLHHATPPAPASQVANYVTGATATSSTSVLLVNTMTFAKVDPAPPIVSPKDSQQQG